MSEQEKMVETMPKVSVIIPIYNAEKFISETIESVVAQTYPDWEIIAVDDGSTDKTPEILKEYAKKLPKKVRVVTQKNSGVSIARNNAIAVAKGGYVAFLDHDDLWMPEKLEKQVKLLNSDEKLGLVYSDCDMIDHEGRLKKGSLFRGKMFRGDVFNELLYADFIPILTAVVKKGVLDKVGVFDPKYKIAEDYDLFLRIAERYPIDFVEQPLAKYRVHGGHASRDVKTAVDEDFQIMEYWLKKKPHLKKELKYRIKLKKTRSYRSLIWYYLGKHEFRKAIGEIKNFMKVLIS